MDFSKIRLFLFDMDGTLYLGNDLFPFTKPMLDEIKKHKITYVWVKGHNGHPYNERCDKMAQNESGKYIIVQD